MNTMTRIDPPPHFSVIVVGGGQAGLAMSWYLKDRDVDHVVFEKHRIGHEWRTRRWDSFCLVTPNWQCQLPGFPYDGDDPHGFMVKDDIVRYIERYAASFDPPVREGVTVKRVTRNDSGVYEVSTSSGEFTADQVVVAIGGYHVPSVPRLAERLPKSVTQLHSSEYKNAGALPPGAVLVVGSGQSGCQIAEDLHLARRKVHLCLGSAPRSPRQYRGKDAVEWLHEMGYYDLAIHEHPQKERVRAKANHYLTGRDGGREIDLRKFARDGMRLYGRLDDFDGTKFTFRADLKQKLDNADAVAESIKATIDKYIASRGIEAPMEPPFKPAWEPREEPRELDFAAAGISSVVWSIGYRADFSWIEVPIFDGRGYPGHTRGVTASSGLYFLGLPWLYTWGSGRFSGVDRDARFLADRIESLRESAVPRTTAGLNELALGS